MKIRFNPLLLTGMALLLPALLLAQKGYVVDGAIKKEIDRQGFGMMQKAVMDIHFFTDGQKADIPALGDGLPSYGTYNRVGDTLRVMLMPMMAPGTAMIIDFYKDTAELYFVQSPRERLARYKQHPGDTAYQTYIAARPLAYKLVLTAPPTGKGAIEGYFEYEGQAFYTKGNGTDIMNMVKAKGYFSAGPL
jgi:hypothetical protein